MADEKTKDFAEDIIKWFKTLEGKKGLDDSLKRSDEAIRKMREACKIDRDILHDPYTAISSNGL